MKKDEREIIFSKWWLEETVSITFLMRWVTSPVQTPSNQLGSITTEGWREFIHAINYQRLGEQNL